MSMSGSQRTHRCRFTFVFIFAMVAWLAPGAAAAQMYFINEDFATGAVTTPPAGWGNDTLIGLATDKWRFDSTGLTYRAPITFPAAIFDSDMFSRNGGPEDVVLTSPSVNTTGHPVVRLRWSQYFEGGAGGSCHVEVQDAGGAWVQVYSNSSTTSNPDLQDIDVSALAANRASVSVRFRWRGDYSWWWIVDNVQLYAPAQPTVTINQAPAQADPASAGPITFAVVFSEAVTGFTGADVSLAGSTATGPFTVNVTGSGTTYEVTVSGMTSNGTVVATIPAGAATSSGSGALNAASTSTDNTVNYTGVAVAPVSVPTLGQWAMLLLALLLGLTAAATLRRRR